MSVDRFHLVSLFISNPCTPSTLSKEAFVYCVCPTEFPQAPFAWKYYDEKEPYTSSDDQATSLCPISLHIYLSMHLCMYVSLYLCAYVCIDVFTRVCIYVCIYVSMHLFTYSSVYAYTLFCRHTD